MSHCCWGLCNSDSQYGPRSKRPRTDMVGVYFIPFPKPKKQLEKCVNWIKLCGNAKITTPGDITRNHYVCSKHFVGGAGPTREHPDPLPAVGGEIEKAHSIAKNRKRPPPKERLPVQMGRKLNFEYDAGVGTSHDEHGHSPQKHRKLEVLERPGCGTVTTSVQTEMCMDDYDINGKERKKDVAAMKRKFINDDIMKNDLSCKFYTGWFVI